MASVGRVDYLDVQPLLERVCDGMAVGELLAADTFSLHDAMTAIEIGDPKMDIGLRREDVGTAEELIAAGQAPAELPPPQLQALLDRLLAMEATWHTGAMLPQTVFTSLYLLDTDRLKANVVLHAYCVALRSTCTAVSDLIVSGQVCEDEDISVHAFGVRLDPPGAQAMAAAQLALEHAVAWLEGGGGGAPDDAGAAAALLPRLRFRLGVVRLLAALRDPSPAAAEAIVALCGEAAGHLTAVQESAQPEAALGAALGFVPDVNRRHMGLVPPRPVLVAPLAAAAAHWAATLAGIAAACRSLLDIASWPQLREALAHFAARPNHPIVRSAMHHLLVKPLRAQLPPPAEQQQQQQQQQQPSAGEPPVPAWCPSPRMIAAEFGLDAGRLPPGDPALFVEQCAIAAQGWCHTQCLNRCRRRRRLRRLLDDWRNMTDHAYNAEADEGLQAALQAAGWRWAPKDAEGALTTGPVAAWVEGEAADTMVAHLQLGVPLELYGPHEYCSIYWYCDYLLSAGHQAHAELRGMRPSPPPARGARGKQGGKGGGAAAPQPPPSQNLKQTAVMLASQLDRLMCQGVVKAAVGLERLGLLGPPPGALSSAAERFRQRFACFAQLQRPDPLHYEDLQAAVEGGELTGGQYLALAYDTFAKADSGAAAVAAGPAAAWLAPEQVRHVAGLRRVAAQNMVALKLLVTALAAAGGGAGGGGAAPPAFQVSWDFKVALQSSGALFFPSLVLKRAAKPKGTASGV